LIASIQPLKRYSPAKLKLQNYPTPKIAPSYLTIYMKAIESLH